jgi:hypothetical protein
MADTYLELRKLVERYADAVCRRDSDDWGATWAKEGEWDLGPGRSMKGRDTIVPFWTQIMGTFPMAIQIVTGGVLLRADESKAAARWYITEYLATGDGGKRVGHGVYHDDYVVEDGEWKFAKRSYNLLYSGAPDLTGDIFPFPAEKAAAAAAG